jgi:putative membrane protein
MKTKIILAVVILNFLVLQACQSPEKRVKTEQSETRAPAPDEAIIPDTLGLNRGANLTIFMNEAALDGMLEIELGKVAAQKATDIHIKRYARRMIKDHTKIAERLKVLADSKKIPLPTVLPKEDLEHIAELQKMPVNEFQKHYMGMMVKGHVKALELFKSATTSGDSPLQNFAIPALRKIEQHYTLAMDISKHLK